MKLLHVLSMASMVWACTHQAATTSHGEQHILPSASKLHTTKTYNDTIAKAVLTQQYTQAISEFIKAAYHNHKTTFDTLYFGKHVYGQPDDFPDITLPETIENTRIRLIAPELGRQKQAAQKKMHYVNMMGWIDSTQANFLFVVFANGAVHQYDYFINFTYNNSTQQLQLSNIYFENYLHLNDNPPKRVVIYENGKYIVTPE